MALARRGSIRSAPRSVASHAPPRRERNGSRRRATRPGGIGAGRAIGVRRASSDRNRGSSGAAPASGGRSVRNARPVAPSGAATGRRRTSAHGRPRDHASACVPGAPGRSGETSTTAGTSVRAAAASATSAPASCPTSTGIVGSFRRYSTTAVARAAIPPATPLASTSRPAQPRCARYCAALRLTVRPGPESRRCSRSMRPQCTGVLVTMMSRYCRRHEKGPRRVPEGLSRTRTEPLSPEELFRFRFEKLASLRAWQGERRAASQLPGSTSSSSRPSSSQEPSSSPYPFLPPYILLVEAPVGASSRSQARTASLHHHNRVGV
jgi:hypothetical protein